MSRGNPILEDLHRHSAAWNEWLKPSERFAVLRIFMDEDAYVYPPGGARERKDWFRSNSDRFVKQVIGMATVAPSALVDKTNKIKAEHLYGVPTKSFVDLEHAVDWLMVHLQATFAGLDAGAIKARAMDLCVRTMAGVH